MKPPGTLASEVDMAAALAELGAEVTNYECQSALDVQKAQDLLGWTPARSSPRPTFHNIWLSSSALAAQTPRDFHTRDCTAAEGRAARRRRSRPSSKKLWRGTPHCWWMAPRSDGAARRRVSVY